ncbi:MAG: RNA-binding protein [Cyanobacteria bacterium WB6_1B_304]|nr:RNA-binding protein [Cyanobacteria bacterium WB6_1B_304]
MSIRLYVGNLSRDLQRQDFENVFVSYNDDLVSVKLIADKKTGKCRGFGFVTVKTEEKADQIVAQLNGYLLEDTPLKIEKALPRTKGEGESEEGEPTGQGPVVNSKRAKTNGRKPSSSDQSSSVVSQPDPRWADKLEQLKAMLAAQATSS